MQRTLPETEAAARMSKMSPEWFRSFQMLCAFQSQTMHLNVPDDGTSLSLWVEQQHEDYSAYVGQLEGSPHATSHHGNRKFFSQSLMNEDKIKLLRGVGFVFRRIPVKQDAVFARNTDLLRAYRNEFGHCNVPTDDRKVGNDDATIAKYKGLGKFVTIARKRMRVTEAIELAKQAARAAAGAAAAESSDSPASRGSAVNGEATKSSATTAKEAPEFNTVDTSNSTTNSSVAAAPKEGSVTPESRATTSTAQAKPVESSAMSQTATEPRSPSAEPLDPATIIAADDSATEAPSIPASPETAASPTTKKSAPKASTTESVLPLTHEQMQRLLDLGLTMRPSRGAKRKLPPPDQQQQQQQQNQANVATIQPEPKRSKKLDERWDRMYQLMKEFVEENGHSIVPHKQTILRRWLVEQRNDYKKLQKGDPSTRMDAVRLQKLTDIKFEFKAKGTLTFEERVQQWLEYRAKNGGKDPKRKSADGLGKWISMMREKHNSKNEGKKNNLTDERVATLNRHGFIWGVLRRPQKIAPRKPWADRLTELIEYKKVHGDTIVPQTMPGLGAWVHSQRTYYHRYLKGKDSVMTAEKIEKLNAIDFAWKIPGRSGGSSMLRDAMCKRQRGGYDDDDEDDDDDSSEGDDEEPYREDPRNHPHHHSPSNGAYPYHLAPYHNTGHRYF